MSKSNYIVVIVGPNASGKSNLGVYLAKKIGGEIISADSRQVYKRLDVGSGKITKKEMSCIKHYCLDVANPKKIFTAYDFRMYAQKAIKEIWKKNKIPIIVGGTGFYIDAAIGKLNLSNIPPNTKLRKKLQKFSTQKIFSMLKKLDSKRAKKIDRNNRVRLVRAIEVLKGECLVFSKSFRSPEKLGPRQPINTISDRGRGFQGENADNPAAKGGTNYRFEKIQSVLPKQILWIGIKHSKKDLKKRIRKRLIARITGIVKEIKKLRNPPAGGGISWKRLFDLGLEYRYVSLYIRGKLNKKDMIKKLETEINKYAKRQMTYWKRNKEIHWVSEKEAKNLGRHFLST